MSEETKMQPLLGGGRGKTYTRSSLPVKVTNPYTVSELQTNIKITSTIKSGTSVPLLLSAENIVFIYGEDVHYPTKINILNDYFGQYYTKGNIDFIFDPTDSTNTTYTFNINNWGIYDKYGQIVYATYQISEGTVTCIPSTSVSDNNTPLLFYLKYLRNDQPTYVSNPQIYHSPALDLRVPTKVDMYIFDEGYHLFGNAQSVTAVENLYFPDANFVPGKYHIAFVANDHDNTEVVNINATDFNDIFITNPEYISNFGDLNINFDQVYVGTTDITIETGKLAAVLTDIPMTPICRNFILAFNIPDNYTNITSAELKIINMPMMYNFNGELNSEEYSNMKLTNPEIVGNRIEFYFTAMKETVTKSAQLKINSDSGTNTFNVSFMCTGGFYEFNV